MRTNHPAKCRNSRSGFTTVELIVSVTVVMIAALSVGTVIAHSSKAYHVEYEKANADVVTDAYVSRRLFDSLIRKAANSDVVIAVDGSTAEVRYYNNDVSTYLDRYARLYTSNGNMEIEYGLINSSGNKQTTSFSTVCGNVSSCLFRRTGNSIRMILTLDDGDKNNVLVTSAYLHN